MALPGLALPGLNFSGAAEEPEDDVEQVTRYHNLPRASEYRFEAPFNHPVTIKVATGKAEFFGTELAPNTPYTFRGAKGAIYSWEGAYLEVTGDPEGDYVAEETPVVQYANVHFALENLREESKSKGVAGPRVLVLGPEDSGKTSLVKFLSAYAMKNGRQPMVVNLDPQEGLLSPPGSLTITTFGNILDVEEGWGSSPISGPTALPVQMPLCYHFGCKNPGDNDRLFRPLITRMALAATSRLEADVEAKASGCIIDTAGSISSAKSGGYELIQHIVSEFSVNVILTIGSEKLYNDVKRRFSASSAEEPVAILRLDKSGGCVDRDAAYMQQLRQSQIREYFFGQGGVTLSPYSQLVDFNQLAIFRIVDPSQNNALASWAGGDEDDDGEYTPAVSLSTLFQKVTPSLGLQNCLLAITHASASDSQDVIKDSSIMGYAYVADVDDAKKKVKLLSPVSGRVPPKALIWGQWPEDVIDMVG